MKDVYSILPRYEKKKKEFLTLRYLTPKGSPKVLVNQKNLSLCHKYIEDKERRLSAEYGVSKDEKIRQYKTLYKDITSYLMNILLWFNDKNFQDLEKEDFQKVYMLLENDELPTITGKSKLSDDTKKDFYTRVFKGGFFKFIGKEEICKKIFVRKFREKKNVTFFKIDTLRVIAENAATRQHKILYWLLFDTGIEVSAICQMNKNNFVVESDEKGSTEVRYYVPVDISKSTRQERNNYLYYSETKKLIIDYLKELEEGQPLFSFGPPAVYRALNKLVKSKNLKTLGKISKYITLKDFRSSCACNLLTENWNSMEIKARLGHSVSSNELERYVNYLAIDTKKKVTEKNQKDLSNIMEQYQTMKQQMDRMQLSLQHREKKLEEATSYMMKLAEDYDSLLENYEDKEEIIDNIIINHPKEAIKLGLLPSEKEMLKFEKDNELFEEYYKAFPDRRPKEHEMTAEDFENIEAEAEEFEKSSKESQEKRRKIKEERSKKADEDSKEYSNYLKFMRMELAKLKNQKRKNLKEK